MITLETLIPLRLVMTQEQLERYGEYLTYKIPTRPFTEQEVFQLTEKKKFQIYLSHCTIERKGCINALKKLMRTAEESRSLVSQAIAMSYQNSQPNLKLQVTG